MERNKCFKYKWILMRILEVGSLILVLFFNDNFLALILGITGLLIFLNRYKC